MIEVLRKQLEKVADMDNKAPMEAYMKHQFTFLGVKAPERKAATSDILRDLKASRVIQWDFVFDCFEQEEREFHYTACDYLRKVQQRLIKSDLKYLKQLICSNSWWDTVDALAIEVGAIGMNSPEIRNETLKQWIHSDQMWLRRVSIIHQLRYKEKTDLEFLSTAIIENLGSQEFFINKAIGWTLRTYSSTDIKWVMAFCDDHNLHPLSKREALRKIKD